LAPLNVSYTINKVNAMFAHRTPFCCLVFGSVLLWTDFMVTSTAAASHHYTQKQMAALAERVGKTYWVREVNGRTPSFFVAPQTAAASFQVQAGDSFEIIELVGQKNKNPYFKARFESGKEGYFPPEVMLEELNLTILTVDPLANERRQAEDAAEKEQQRVDWINAQPWPAAAKEAALKGQAVPGMNYDEVKKIVGPPRRVTKVQGRGTTAEEHWIYPDKQLVFQQGLLTQIIAK
jgi:hypothetical protein